MIVSGEVEQSVQDEDACFILDAVTEIFCIFGCNIDGNGDIARELAREWFDGGKREHVGGLVFAAEGTIHGTHLAARREQHVDFAANAGGFARRIQEAE